MYKEVLYRPIIAYIFPNLCSYPVRVIRTTPVYSLLNICVRCVRTSLYMYTCANILACNIPPLKLLIIGIFLQFIDGASKISLPNLECASQNLNSCSQSYWRRCYLSLNLRLGRWVLKKKQAKQQYIIKNKSRIYFWSNLINDQ